MALNLQLSFITHRQPGTFHDPESENRKSAGILLRFSWSKAVYMLMMDVLFSFVRYQVAECA